jgi:hypothetical protein
VAAEQASERLVVPPERPAPRCGGRDFWRLVRQRVQPCGPPCRPTGGT